MEIALKFVIRHILSFFQTLFIISSVLRMDDVLYQAQACSSSVTVSAATGSFLAAARVSAAAVSFKGASVTDTSAPSV
jgi:hypothetical protein